MTVISVPDDFPSERTPTALTGVQPKLAARRIDGQVVVGLTPHERYERWELCEDLAQQLVPRALKDAERHRNHSHDITLQRVRRAVEAKNWVSVVEANWVIARLRTLLGW